MSAKTKDTLVNSSFNSASFKFWFSFSYFSRMFSLILSIASYFSILSFILKALSRSSWARVFISSFNYVILLNNKGILESPLSGKSVKLKVENILTSEEVSKLSND